jgi:hypothetical protein
MQIFSYSKVPVNPAKCPNGPSEGLVTAAAGFFLVSPDLSRSREMLSDSWTLDRHWTLELTYDR